MVWGGHVDNFEERLNDEKNDLCKDAGGVLSGELSKHPALGGSKRSTSGR